MSNWTYFASLAHRLKRKKLRLRKRLQRVIWRGAASLAHLLRRKKLSLKKRLQPVVWRVSVTLRKLLRRSVVMTALQLGFWFVLIGAAGFLFTYLAVYLEPQTTAPTAGGSPETQEASKPNGPDWQKIWSSLSNNVGSGLFGALMTVLTIEILKESRSAKEKREQTIRTLRGKPNRDNTEELADLDINGWLLDYSVAGANLEQANFTGASLSRVKMPFCNLTGANFSRANLSYGDFRGAILRDANFSESILLKCDMRSCELTRVDVEYLRQQGAILE